MDGIETNILYMRRPFFNHDPLHGIRRYSGRRKHRAADLDTSLADSNELFNGVPFSAVQAKGRKNEADPAKRPFLCLFCPYCLFPHLFSADWS